MEGQRTDEVFAIEHGTVRITVTTSTGAQLLLAERGPGELVGELAPLDGGPRSATMTAKGTVSVWVLTGQRFTDVLTQQPALAVGICKQMARRLRQLGTQHGGRSEELSVRVAQRLLLLVEERGHTDLQITQQELADWVGATREATARVLTDLREEDLVQTGRGKIIVLDAERLHR